MPVQCGCIAMETSRQQITLCLPGGRQRADRQRSGDWHLPCAAFLHLESTLKMEAMRRGMELNLDVDFVAFPAMSEEI